MRQRRYLFQGTQQLYQHVWLETSGARPHVQNPNCGSLEAKVQCCQKQGIELFEASSVASCVEARSQLPTARTSHLDAPSSQTDETKCHACQSQPSCLQHPVWTRSLQPCLTRSENSKQCLHRQCKTPALGTVYPWS